MQKVMRPTREGGVSLCGASPDRVGKGRCHHILSEEDVVTVSYNSDDRCYYINLENAKSKLTLHAQEKAIVNFFEEIQSSITDEEREKFINFLNK